MKTWKTTIISVLVVVIIVAAAYIVGSGTIFHSQNASAASALYSQDTVTSIYEKASPAVVEIEVTQTGNGFFGKSTSEGQGSGFLVDEEGYILTNNHVVEDASSVTVILNDGTRLEAEVSGTDSLHDLAVVKVDAGDVAGITPLEFSDSSQLKPGQMAIAIGTPYGLNNTITVGIVSGLNRTLSGSSITGMIQTDASINSGNSGGPLLNDSGAVIGINTAIESGANGIGFAVPSNTATQVLSDLKNGNKIVRPWIGISGMAITKTLAEELDLTVNQGVYILSVVEDSPAQKAGLKGSSLDSSGKPVKGGDVITAADDTSVKSVQELSSYISTRKVGDEVTLTIMRDGSSQDVKVTLAAWPSETQVTKTQDDFQTPGQIPGMPGGKWYFYSTP